MLKALRNFLRFSFDFDSYFQEYLEDNGIDPNPPNTEETLNYRSQQENINRLRDLDESRIFSIANPPKDEID